MIDRKALKLRNALIIGHSFPRVRVARILLRGELGVFDMDCVCPRVYFGDIQGMCGRSVLE